MPHTILIPICFHFLESTIYTAMSPISHLHWHRWQQSSEWCTFEKMHWVKGSKCLILSSFKRCLDLQDGGGIRRGDHLPPHKYVRTTSTCGTTPTEHLLNAGRRPQTSQKARKSPCTWVGQKKKRKKNKNKRIGMGPEPLGGSCEGGNVSTH